MILDLKTKRYATFTLSRPHFWCAYFGIALIAVLVTITSTAEPASLAGFLALLGCVTIAVVVARIRDAGLNGWWALTLALPFGVGQVAMIYFGCIRPDDHPKKLRAIEKLRTNDKGAIFK